MARSDRRRASELLEKARHEHDKLEEKLWKSFAFRAYLVSRRSGVSANPDRTLAKNEDFARWCALDRLLEKFDRHAQNRTLH
jgi:hypothetical protein